MTRILCHSSFPIERARAAFSGAGLEVDAADPPFAGDDVVALLAFAPVSASDLERMPSLRVVATPSVGVDHIDVAAASGRGVWVCNVPDYCVEEMADHVLALLLALVRGVVALDRTVVAGDWDYMAAGALQRLSDVRLGVIGFGRIGRAFASRALALGMDVCAFDPIIPDDEIVAVGARPLSLRELCSTCTAVSLHAPLTPETRGLVGAAELRLLPKGAFVVNVSRGPLLDVEAALAALESGSLGGLALDVLDVEPPTPSAPAPASPRLIVTPHAGWYSEQAEEAVLVRSLASVKRVLDGLRPGDAVNDPIDR